MDNKEEFENEKNMNNNYNTICNPKDYFNDDIETDDILTKLGNLSESDDKSFDSPIIFNRTKTFYEGYNTDAKNLFEDYLEKRRKNYSHLYKHRSNSNFNKVNNTFNANLKSKVLNRKVFETKSLVNMKSNQSIINKKYFKDKKLKRLKSEEIIPEIVRNNSNINFVNYNKLNIKNDELPVINENINLPSVLENENKDNTENKVTIGLINEKIENINILMKDMKEIDKKLKKKDLNKILNNYIINLKESEIKNNNLYEPINELLDFINELLISIQNHSLKSNNKIGNEKIILKLQNEIKEKDKEIGELMNKMNLEKNKLEDSFKSNNVEIINLRKSNKELYNKLQNCQKHISKLEINNSTLEEKLNKIILEKTSKTISSSTSVRTTFIGSIPKMEPISLDSSIITQIQPQKSIDNKNKLNDKLSISKKLNLNLIDLLKEINNMICHYDTFLNKECGGNKNMSNLVKNLYNSMDVNALNEDKKMKMLKQDFMRNMDKVYKKLEEFIKEVNTNNNSRPFVKNNSSNKVIIKKEKKNSVNKSNLANNTKNNIKNVNNFLNCTRKRTNTMVINTKKKDGI